MPYVSKAQMRWAFATHQPFAKRWEDATDRAGGVSRLPQHVKHKGDKAKKPSGADMAKAALSHVKGVMRRH